MTRLLRVGPGPLLFVGIFLLLMAGGRSRLFRDPGTFWHIRVGEKILADGFFDTDPYSFTRFGEHWVPHQWLGETTLAVAHRAGGFETTLLLTAATIAGLYTWLASRLLRTGLHPVVAVSVVALGLAAAANHYHVRPHMVTVVGLAMTVAALTDYEAGRIGLRRVGLLVPLYVLWANIHGGILGGLATIALAGGGWMVWAFLGWPSPLRGWRAVLGFAAVFVGCGLAALVNPYGPGIPRAWLAILSLGDLGEYVQEHAPPDFSDPSNWPLLGLAALYLFVLAGVRERPRVAWLLPLFWLFEAYSRVRHGPLFVAAVLVAIADAWPVTAWARRLAARRPDLYDPSAPGRPVGTWGWAIPAAGLVAVVAVQVAGVRVPVVGAGWVRFDPDRWPVELLDTIREHEPSPTAPGRVFNECEFGGFLIYYAPGYRVFFDDRFELYGGEMTREFVRAGAEGTRDRIAEWQARYGRFDAALVRTGGGFDEYFRSDYATWECVKRTDSAAFYIRRKSAGWSAE